jgi:hypothetical protein
LALFGTGFYRNPQKQHFPTKYLLGQAAEDIEDFATKRHRRDNNFRHGFTRFSERKLTTNFTNYPGFRRRTGGG